jgi:hypothetical protein
MTPPILERTAHAWRAMEPEQRLAALAALGLFASMFLPWYSKTNTLVVHGAVKATETSLTAFQAFSFVEAAVLLVSAAVLAMLFARVEGRSFQLPGGDGLIVMIAGGWTSLLIFYRLLEKPGVHGNERVTATVGVEWGIFVALLLALGLVYAGGRMRALEAPEPPLRRPRRTSPRPAIDPDATIVTPRPVQRQAVPAPAPSPSPSPSRGAAGAPAPEPAAASKSLPGSDRTPARGSAAARDRARYPPPPPPGQLSFEDPPSRPE